MIKTLRPLMIGVSLLLFGSCEGRHPDPEAQPPQAVPSVPDSPPPPPSASPTDPDLVGWEWEFPTVETLNVGDRGPYLFPHDPPARPFVLSDLSPEDQAYYRDHAGIYVHKKRPPGWELSRRLLQLRRCEFTWGPDFYLEPPYGVLDWGGNPPGFQEVSGSGGFNPLPLLAQNNPRFDIAHPLPEWVRASDPEHPMALLKQVLAEKARKWANRPPELLSPRQAQEAVGDLYLKVLNALRNEAYDELLGLLSRRHGLTVAGHHHSWEEWSARVKALPQEASLPVEKRYQVFQEPGEPDYTPLALRYGILQGSYKIYPSLFVNAEVDEFTRRFGNGVLFEFQSYFKGQPNQYEQLSMAFVSEDGAWKLADLELWANLE